MLSIKLHEATKQFKISNKLAMFFLEKLNVPVKSHSSVISMDQLEMLREFSSDKNKYPEIRGEFDRLEKAKKMAKKAKESKVTEDKGTEGISDVRKEKAPEPSKEPVRVETPVEKVKEVHPSQTTPTQPSRPPQPPAPTSPVTPQAPRPSQAPPQRPQHNAPHHHPHKQGQVISRSDGKESSTSHRAPQRPQGQSRPDRERSEQRPERRTDRPPYKPGDRDNQRPGNRPDFRQDRRQENKPDNRVAPVADQKTMPKKKVKPQVKESSKEIEKELKLAAEEHDFKRAKAKKDNIKEKGKFLPKKGKAKFTKSVDAKGKLLENGVDKSDDTTTPAPVTPPPQRPSHGKPYQGSRPHGQRSHGSHRQQVAKPAPPPPAPKKPKVFNLPEMIQTSNFITIKELAEKLNLKLKDIEEKLSSLDRTFMTNQILDIEEIKEICAAFKVEVDIVSYEDDVFFNQIEKSKAEKVSRAPVVTVMGHVDHGKTTLLDTLRDSRVADREAGGITQKIGAYKLNYKGNDIVFIDTPGHEAFTNIRARGAKVTDIVILVVAANDGVKPQTVEAINHALAAKVPIIVAINKIDIAGASPDKVKQELTKHNIVVEDWGGDVVSVEISAKHNQNLDALLEMITLVSEMQELKYYKSIPARGTIIEAHLDPKLGPMGTVLLQHGVLKKGDFFICGNSVGKVKNIFDDSRDVLDQAEAPLPVEIMGFEDVPEAGELFQVTVDVDKARKVVDSRIIRGKEAEKEESGIDKKMSLQNLFQRLQEEQTQTFPIIMKTDNFSSVEVLENILMKYDQETLKINIVLKGIGNITESDIQLASTSGSIIVGFNVKAPQKLMALAKREKVEIKLYNVIYHLIEDIDKAIKGELKPEYIETRIGAVEVLQLFKISKIGIIAGCLVKEGKVTKKSKIKVLRKSDLVFEGDIDTLRRVKNEANEVNAGTECGIKIANFNAIEVGDILEVYETTIKER